MEEMVLKLIKEATALEQITDDFAVKLLVWMANLDHKNDELKHIDYENSSDEEIATELLQIFKTQVYE